MTLARTVPAVGLCAAVGGCQRERPTPHEGFADTVSRFLRSVERR